MTHGGGSAREQKGVGAWLQMWRLEGGVGTDMAFVKPDYDEP